MGSEKRERQKQARQQKLQEHKVTTKKGQRGRQLRAIVLITVAVLGAALLISIFSGGGDDEVTTTDPAADADTDTDGDDAADGGDGTDGPPSTIEVELPGEGAAITGETPCPPEDGSAERTTSFDGPPPDCLTPGTAYQAVLATTEGDITIGLDAEAAPLTVNNFVVLARYGFYDGVPFHRIIPGFMNQAGDPVGPRPGTGGPGYTIPDELPEGDDPYPEGTVAMANTGAADSGGSQFFIVVEDGGDQLTPTYSVFGRVVEGIEVARAINEFGDAASNGTPTEAITITSVTIVKSPSCHSPGLGPRPDRSVGAEQTPIRPEAGYCRGGAAGLPAPGGPTPGPCVRAAPGGTSPRARARPRSPRSRPWPAPSVGRCRARAPRPAGPGSGDRRGG
jgi:cyclophilin family peptidyl-prolyl cis-trans isomerase